MQYLLLIYQNEANDAKRTEAEANARRKAEKPPRKAKEKKKT